MAFEMLTRAIGLLIPDGELELHQVLNGQLNFQIDQLPLLCQSSWPILIALFSASTIYNQ
jgi:hypothetical protein